MKMISWLLSLSMICPTLWGAPESSPLPADLTAVPFGQVTVRDRLWAPWRERMDRVTLPHCLVKTEPAVENLRRTAHFLSGVPDRMPFFAFEEVCFSIAVQRYNYLFKLQTKSIIFIAVIAHSSPLLPSLPPALSSACSIVLVVINP